MNNINNMQIDGSIRSIITKNDDVIVRLDCNVRPRFFIDCYCNKNNNKSVYNAILNNYKILSPVIVSGKLLRVDDMFRIDINKIKPKEENNI